MRTPRFYTREVLKNLAPIYCRGRMLDIGAGRAKYLEYFKPHISEYVALDNLSSSVQFKKESAKERVNVIGDALDLPFNAESFDTVCSIEVLEHVEDPFRAFTEMSRVLKVGGYCIVASGWLTPYHAEPKNYFQFSLDGYEILGRKAGLTLVESRKQGGIFSVLLYIIVRTIQLHMGATARKLLVFFNEPKIWLERLAEFTDRFIDTPDSIGHVMIYRKP